MRTSLLVASLALLGCVTPMRASNRSAAPDEPASVRFPGGTDDALTWLTSAFMSEGYAIPSRYGRAPNTVYVFQRERAKVPAGGGVYWGRKGRAPAQGWDETVAVGSVFYVYLQPGDANSTYITLYGKPTVAGHELCGGEDRYWRLPCEEVEAPTRWEGRAELDGHAEAGVVRQLLGGSSERSTYDPIQVVPTFRPPPTLHEPPTELAAGCYWDYATGSRFQTQVCQGEPKTAFEERQLQSLTSGPTPQGRPGVDGATRSIGNMQ